MKSARTLLLVVALTALLAIPALAQSPSTHYRALINATHEDPRNMTVVVVPPGYLSTSAQLPINLADHPLMDHPGTLALLEATDYWNWTLRQYQSEWPHLANVTYAVKVLGHDATPGDLLDADIVVTTGMANDPLPFIFHLGVGLPTGLAAVFLNQPMHLCTVWNTGLGSLSADVDPLRLRNLMIHEFGHCLSAGHTYGAPYPDLDPAEDDVMAGAKGTHRQCISNLNVQSIADGYDWMTVGDGMTWAPAPAYSYMLQSDYEQKCMPPSMKRF